MERYGMAIAYNPDDDGYFKAHPDVKKCQYKDCVVEQIIGNINSMPHCIDEISIVIGDKEKQNGQEHIG